MNRPLSAIVTPLMAGAIWLTGANGAAFAVQSPFGIATPDSTGPAFTGPLGSFFVWVALRQSEFYKALTGALDQVKHSGHAFILLAGISFLYGVFHAVGPGHGKAVITSYLLVSRQTVKRGIVIAFFAALMQGLVAIGVVLIAAALLHATAVSMTRATDWFEILSYGLVAAVGAWLLFTKLTGRGHHHHDGVAADHHHHDQDHDHGHAHRHDHAHDHGHNHDHAHTHNHAHSHAHDETCASCGHSHAPDPKLLSRPLTATRAWAATLAVGIRPCSGAIIVLVFALSQQLLLAGIGSVLAMSLGTFITVSTLAVLAVSAKDVALRIAGLESTTTERIMHVVEIAGALLVLLLGLTLLGGALQGGLP
ncbi:MAG: delayed-early response protein/equilibrative nucleoside transporter [Rhodopseudomonas sp.]|nr:delayed-early response protein/equilibrative nucleoside transporter [Rhodopseudomonas sp.]